MTFGTSGKVIYDKDKWDLYQDVKIQPDGKIVAVGSSMNAAYSTVIEVSRYMPDGTFDPSFGSAGHYTYSANVESGAYKCLIKDDGKILICGYTTNYSTYYMLIIQLDEYGVPDPAFGAYGIVLQQLGPQENNVFAITRQNDGKILTAGYSQDNNYNYIPVVLRFSETGVLDTSFGASGIATIPVTQIDNDFSAIRIQSDGKIVAAGHISNGQSWFSLLIARFDQNGILDPGYGTGGIVNMNLNNVDDEFFDMALSANDDMILTGFTVTQADLYYHLLVMKFDADGLPVNSFGNNGKVIYGNVPYTTGDAMLLQADGKIMVAGCTGELQPANNDWALWRFNPDGSLDNTFGTDGIVTTDFFGNSDDALGVALYLDKIIVAGKIRNATDYLDFALARYDNDFNVSVPDVKEKLHFSVTPTLVKQNSLVELSFGLGQPQLITMEMVNLSGSPVMTIQSGNKPAGNNSIKFSIPSTLPAGCYLIRLKGSESSSNFAKLIVTD